MILRRIRKIILTDLSIEGHNALRKIGKKGFFGVYEKVQGWRKKGSLTFSKKVTNELLDQNLIKKVYVTIGIEPHAKKYLKYVRTEDKGLKAYSDMTRK